ncbi:MAG: hypothetical protein R3F49_02455 [Planctomycetota bacterium]
MTLSARAQERPVLTPPGAGSDPQAEMLELFKKVEKRLNRMSELLGQASAGDIDALQKVGSAGIDELIRNAEAAPAASTPQGLGGLIAATQSHGREVVKEIDEVLELARQQAQQQQQQSGGGGGGQSQSPPQPGGQPKQGQTPENSRQMQGEQAPQPGQGQEPKNEPQPGGSDPQRGEDNPPVTPQENGEAPPGADIGAPASAEEGGQWGDLPVHVRRVFRNGVSEDVPPRYRDWIDAYHKRLSTRPPR